MIIIRHGEIFTKSEPVRKDFIRKLFFNIREALPDDKVDLKRWRIFVESADEIKSAEILQHVFGIVSVSIAVKVKADLEEISKTALTIVPEGIKTFGVHTQRITKEFPQSSNEISGEVGYYILQHKKLKVDLKNPDAWIKIEVYGDFAYVFSKNYEGPGGLPVSSAKGTVECDYTGEHDALAAWMMLKRGAFVTKSEKLAGWDYGNIPDEPLAKVIGTTNPAEFVEAQKNSLLPVFSPLVGMSEEEVVSMEKKIFG